MVTLMAYTICPQALPLLLNLSSNTSYTASHGYISQTKLSTCTTGRAPQWATWVRQSDTGMVQDNGCSDITDTSMGFSEAFSQTGSIFALFLALGLDEKEVVAVLSDHPSIGFMSVQSIRRRIKELQLVGLNEIALSKLIAKYPDVIIADEVHSLVQFVKGLENKIEPSQIERLLLTTPPSLLAGFEKKVKLLIKHGVPVDKITHVLNNVNLNKAICLRCVEEIQRMLTLLTQYDAVGIIAKRPQILSSDLDRMVTRIEFLEELSTGDKVGVGKVLNRLPAFLTYSVEHLRSLVDFLSSYVGLTDQEIFKILRVFPSILGVSKERKLRPRIDFLKECGFDSGEIYRFLIKAPLFVAHSFEKNLAHKLSILLKVGFAPKTKELALAMGATSRTTTENLQGVIGSLLNYGFSCDDIVAMSKKHYQILQYNPRSLEEKMEYLVEEMDRDIKELMSFPAFLGYNLDRRIKHRYEQKKEVLASGMSFNKLFSMSSKRFSKAKKDSIEVECDEVEI